MKNTYIILIIAMLGTLGITSCDVDLDEHPEGLLAPESFYRTEGDFIAAIAGTYQPIFKPWGGFNYDYLFAVTAGAEDIGVTAGSLLGFDRLQNDPTIFWNLSVWTDLYSVAANASTIVGNLGNAEGIPADRLNEFEAEAKFMRAFAYFYLVRLYGEIQLITEENISIANEVAQTSVADIYALIISDLQFAENNLPDESISGRASVSAAKGFLAKVYLTMTGWPIEDASYYALARDKAKEIIGLYSLEPNFADLWKHENRLTNSEWIFAFHASVDHNVSNFHNASRSGIDGGWGDWSSEARLFYAFPDGPRKDATFTSVFSNGQTFEEAGIQPFSSKYRDAGPDFPFDATSGPVNGDGSICMLRYADVLLIYAEAANMAGALTPEALEAINQVRRRAMGLPVDIPDAAVDLTLAISQEDFDDAVIAERNWELAHEGNRWFDLVRKKMVVEVNVDMYPDVSETDRLLPKPSTQVSVLPGLLIQNPGY